MPQLRSRDTFHSSSQCVCARERARETKCVKHNSSLASVTSCEGSCIFPKIMSTVSRDGWFDGSCRGKKTQFSLLSFKVLSSLTEAAGILFYAPLALTPNTTTTSSRLLPPKPPDLFFKSSEAVLWHFIVRQQSTKPLVCATHFHGQADLVVCVCVCLSVSIPLSAKPLKLAL